MKQNTYLNLKAELYEFVHDGKPAFNWENLKLAEARFILEKLLSPLERDYIPTPSSMKELETFKELIQNALLLQHNENEILKALVKQKLIKKFSEKAAVIIMLLEKKKPDGSKKFFLDLVFERQKNREAFLSHLKAKNLEFSPLQQTELTTFAQTAVVKTFAQLITTRQGPMQKNLFGQVTSRSETYNVGIRAFMQIDGAVEIPLPTKNILLAFQRFFFGCLPLDAKEIPGSSLFWLSINCNYAKMLLKESEQEEKKRIKSYGTYCRVKSPLSASLLVSLCPKLLTPLADIICQYNAHDCSSPDEICSSKYQRS